MKRKAARVAGSKPSEELKCSWALVLVDGSRIRQEIKRAYEKVLRDLEHARAQLDYFQQQDQPRFSRWFNSQFGALLTELRQTSQRIEECDRLLFEMEAEVVLGGTTPGRAYERVMRRHNNPEEPPAQEEPERSGEDRSSEEPHFDDFAGSRHKKKMRSARKPLCGSAGARLKDLYRAVVRRLHPDTQREMTSRKLEWWHRAQAAYQKGDAGELEVILTLCEIDESGHVERASVSILQRITAQFKKTLRQIKTQLAKCRRDPAWNFCQRKDIDALAKTMRRQLTHDLNVLKDELRAMEREMALWAAQPKQRRYAQYRRRRQADPFFGPFESFF